MSDICGPKPFAGSILLVIGCATGIGACALPNLPTPGPSADMRLAPRQTTHVTSAPGGIAPPRFFAPAAPPTAPMSPIYRHQHYTLGSVHAVGAAHPAATIHTVAAVDTRTPGTVRPQAAVKRVVRFRANYPAGAIVIVNAERSLYLVGNDGTAIRYPVAIGNNEQQWTGLEFVTAKRVNPTWYPVSAPGQPAPPPIPGGHPDNPLGPRALYLGSTLWRIHGTPAPGSIGRAVSNGCIRMLNEDVLDLYDRIPLGTEVFVIASLTAPAPVLPGAKLAR